MQTLTQKEKQTAQKIAEAIAQSPLSKDKVVKNHYPEAEAIALMERPQLQAQEILLDELAARTIAKERGIPVTGFAGVLIRANRRGLSRCASKSESMLFEMPWSHVNNKELIILIASSPR